MTDPANTETARDHGINVDGDVDSRDALLVSTAQQAVLPRELEDGKVYAALVDGNIQILPTPGYLTRQEDETRPTPKHITRKAQVVDVDSFIDYLACRTNHDDGQEVGPTSTEVGNPGALEVWADPADKNVTAIIDGLYGWQHSQVKLALETPPAWKDWALVDGKLLPQAEFAEFVEDHLSTIGEPDGAQLLDVCQTLSAKTGVHFKSSQMLDNGQRQFIYDETITAKAGTSGSLKVPTALKLVLSPYVGLEPRLIDARFRYRISEGQLYLGVHLVEPATVQEASFTRMLEEIAERIPVHINVGSPRAYY